jgi:putative oxidoreductase
MHTYSTSQNAALLVLRIIVAITFFHAGVAKLFLWSIEPMEGSPVWLHYMMLFLSIAEPIGATAVVAGFLTRAAAACLAIIMIGSIPVSQFMMGVPFFTAPQLPGWDANLMILGGCATLAAFGAGAWSVDALRRQQSESVSAHGTPRSTSSATSARGTKS